MNIFDQYGIKEVADVTLYSIHKKKDGSGDVYYVPALYLDTLKISSVEKTAENVWAQGGLGNSRLICWDYGKQINVTLEDALCTPASLGLCWGGVLSSDWKDGKVQHDLGITWDKNYVDKISRMEKAFYPRNDKETSTVSYLLPQSNEDLEITKAAEIIHQSQVVDGTKVCGFGYVGNKTYKWNMAIETDMKSIAVVPEKFFDVQGNSYPIVEKRAVGIRVPSSGESDDFKYEITYKINTEDYKEEITPENANVFYLTGSARYYEGGGKVDISKIKFIANTKTYDNLGVLTMAGEYYNFEANEYLGNGKLSYRAVLTEADTGHFGEYFGSSGVNPFIHTDISIDNQGDGSAYYLFTIDSALDSTYGQDVVVALEGIPNIFIEELDSNIGLQDIKDSEYLKIRVDNNDNYFAYIEKDGVFVRTNLINTQQFKNIDMWIKFDHINELIYFLITKYEDNIYEIISADILYGGKVGEDYEVKDQDLEAEEVYKKQGKLWAYVNPKTMTPYPDDYWFHQGESYYVKSLTLAPKHKELKAQKITVTAGQFPGMYMLVGETYIRSRDTGEDERMQIKFPLCKVKSDQNLTLEAEGDPTVFNLDIEVARPVSGIMMELTAYEVAEKIQIGDNGMVETKDGSTEILSE